MACPACDHAVAEPLLRREGVPAAQNVLVRDRALARDMARGTLDLVGCPACGHVWNRAFDRSKVSYGETYENRQDLSPRFHRHLRERVAFLNGLVGARKNVIEVGCGNGTFLELLCEVGDHRGVGYDTAYRGPESKERTRFVRGYYGPDQAFVPADLVVCRHVIEHVEEPRDLLDGIRGALAGRPETRVVFECPDFSWISAHDAVWDIFHEHVQYFSAASLATLFRRAGYQDVAVETVFDGQYLQAVTRPSQRQGIALPRPISSPLSAARAFALRHAERESRWSRFLDEGGLVVWGAGAKGVTFVTSLDPEGRRIQALVDVNPAKQGGFVPVSGHPIVSPDDLDQLGVRRVLVLNPAYLGEVRARCPHLEVFPPEIPCDSSSTTKLAS